MDSMGRNKITEVTKYTTTWDEQSNSRDDLAIEGDSIVT